MSRKLFCRFSVALGLGATVVALLLVARPATAQQPAWGSKLWPWNVQGYQGYTEPKRPPSTPPASPTAVYPARKYTVVVNPLPLEPSEGDPNAAHLMAHLPEDAAIWFEDAPTTQTGTIRYFVSPPLTPGTNYIYTARVSWVEDGRQVSQTRRFPVRPGEMQCLDIVPANSKQALEQEGASLAKLSPEDRALAERQKFCAVQTDKRLGSMGTPVKVMIKGQPVFLCCEGCMEQAEGSPAKTLAKVKELQSKGPGAPGK